jgi:hypothetical protein
MICYVDAAKSARRVELHQVSCANIRAAAACVARMPIGTIPEQITERVHIPVDRAKSHRDPFKCAVQLRTAP